MIDYTSSLYLDMRHESRELQPWEQLTSGSPAALGSVAGTDRVEHEIARLMGCESALVCRSTLHAFSDVFETVSESPLRIYCDSGAYPIAKWAIERRQAAGDLVRQFPEHDVARLTGLLRADSAFERVPVLVADTLSIRSGRMAPLQAYAHASERFGGWLIVDDTQGFGLVGESGGGSLRCHQLQERNVLVIASMAKSFGVPVAILGGSAMAIDRFRDLAPTRYHSSPPSAADIAAVHNALRLNRLEGDERRRLLFSRVRFFQNGLRQSGLAAAGGMFPLQTLPDMDLRDARRLHAALARRGVRALLLSAPGTVPAASVGFLITARHTFSELKATLEAVRDLRRTGHAGTTNVRERAL